MKSIESGLDKQWSDKELIFATDEYIKMGKDQNKIFWGEEGHECGICGMNPAVLEKAIIAYKSQAAQEALSEIIGDVEKHKVEFIKGAITEYNSVVVKNLCNHFADDVLQILKGRME